MHIYSDIIPFQSWIILLLPDCLRESFLYPQTASITSSSIFSISLPLLLNPDTSSRVAAATHPSSSADLPLCYNSPPDDEGSQISRSIAKAKQKLQNPYFIHRKELE